MDPTSDMLIRLKNAQRAGHEIVRIPYARMLYNIAKVLESTGLIGIIEKKGKRTRKILEIALHSKDSEQSFHGVYLISKPGRKLYLPSRMLRPSRKGGVIILSTSKGVMDAREARRSGLGGMIIAEVW